MIKIIVSLVLLASFMPTAKAQDYSIGKIKEIEINSNDSIKILQENALFPDRCRAISRYWHIVGRKGNRDQDFLIVLLAAYQSGQSVYIRRVGHGVCRDNRLPAVTEILLR